MTIVGYQIMLRITRFVTLVIRPDYQKVCLRSTPDVGRVSDVQDCFKQFQYGNYI